MTIPTVTKNLALDAWPFDGVSYHSDFPGTTGANEISGGSYSRPSVSVALSSGGTRVLSAQVTSPVPACTIRWQGWWSTGGDLLLVTPNGGALPKNFVSIPGGQVFYSANHGFTDGQTVAHYQGSPSAPFVEGTVYYVRDATTHTFKLAATLGGAAIDITGAPSFGCVISAITEKTYAAPAAHTVTVANFLVPD